MDFVVLIVYLFSVYTMCHSLVDICYSLMYNVFRTVDSIFLYNLQLPLFFLQHNGTTLSDKHPQPSRQHRVISGQLDCLVQYGMFLLIITGGASVRQQWTDLFLCMSCRLHLVLPARQIC